MRGAPGPKAQPVIVTAPALRTTHLEGGFSAREAADLAGHVGGILEGKNTYTGVNSAGRDREGITGTPAFSSRWPAGSMLVFSPGAVVPALGKALDTTRAVYALGSSGHKGRNTVPKALPAQG
jgi:hypothetical protein